MTADAREHLHFVTGRLAEPSLRELLAELAPAVGFDYTVESLGITVAALMTCRWVAPRLHVPECASRVVLPGYCLGELDAVAQACGRPVVRGPKDLRELPGYFEHPLVEAQAEGRYDIEILAEINHASRLSLPELVSQARQLAADGADLVDLGCVPGEIWNEVRQAVSSLRAEGLRVSIDSLEPAEIAPAVGAGAELVLSVNSSNRQAAVDWPVEVVAIPDVPGDWASLEATLEWLDAHRVRFCVDPILEPIGFGLAASLGRYLEARRRWPEAEMLMGIGNLTELTDVDSAGMNVLLLGFCQELGIRRVLTTQVIPWCQSAVRECDLARRLVYRAVIGHRLPKHLEPRLVQLRDPQLTRPEPRELERLAAEIRDPNYRIFVGRQGIALVSSGLYLEDGDPFRLLEQLLAAGRRPLAPEHAFYLGYELAKAATALTLGKQYRQDEALDWGLLTRAESSLAHRRADPSPPAAEPPEAV